MMFLFTTETNSTHCSSGVRFSLRAKHENCWGKEITELDNRLNVKYYQTKNRLNKNMSVISCHKKQNHMNILKSNGWKHNKVQQRQF
jgi:hypothetical protein